MVDLSIPILLRDYPTGAVDPRIGSITIQPWNPEELREYVVQFTRSLLAYERREMQTAYRLSLEEYVPKYAYLEMIDEEAAAALPQHPQVNAVFPMIAVLRAMRGMPEPFAGDEAIPQTPFDDVAAAEPPIRLLWVVLNSRANPAAVAEKLGELGAAEMRIFDDRINGGVARVQAVMPEASIAEIAAIEGVRWYGDVPQVSADSGALGDLLEAGVSPAPAGLDLALKNGLRGKGEVIGIIDAGSLDTEHCWFADGNGAAIGPTHRKLVANRDVTRTGVATHPAFVAGIVAGDDFNNPGAAEPRGLACDAKIAFGNRTDTVGIFAVQTVYDYLVRASGDKAYVHNTSWHAAPGLHTFGFEYSPIAHDVDRFTWERQDCLIVASSGNNGEDMGPPCSAKNSLCVSAAFVDPATGKACLADGVHGPTEDRRRKPDLLAPGCNIQSAFPAPPPAAETGEEEPDHCLTDFDRKLGNSPGKPTCDTGDHYCASSFAAPVATAAAAIVRQYFVEGRYPTGEAVAAHTRTPSAALIKATLLNATERAGTGAMYPTDAEGWGLLRLERILRLKKQPRKIRVWDVRAAAGLFTAETRTHRFEIKAADAGKPLKITLVWSDPPGQPVAIDPVVNDLDLVVTAPDAATRYLGNWFRFGASHPGTPARPAQPDSRNNVETVFLRAAPAGTWTITVKATEVNVGNTGQGYALVVRGALA